MTKERIEYAFARRLAGMGASAIREILKVTERPEVISFAGGLPAPEVFPVEELARAHAEVFAKEGAQACQYSTTEGWLPLREWIAARMRLRGVRDADAGRVLVTSGSQQGIDLVGKIFLDPGDCVVVENPCYLAALQVLKGYEATLVAVGSDDEGMRVDEIEGANDVSMTCVRIGADERLDVGVGLKRGFDLSRDGGRIGELAIDLIQDRGSQQQQPHLLIPGKC